MSVDLDEIEKLAREATAGPWTIHEELRKVYRDGEIDEGGYRIDAHDIEQLAYVWRANKRLGNDPRPFGAPDAEASARFIAALSPDVVLALIEMARRGIGR